MIARVEVLESRPLTATSHHVRVTRPPGFDFAPVQFVGLELATEQGPEEYSMSLASSPTRDHLEFGARLSASPWKRAFAALRPGDEAEIDGPYGHFVLDTTRPAVLVAGGIGITPLKGMLEFAIDTRMEHDVALVYSDRSPDEIAYREELHALVKMEPRARLYETITQEADGWTGRTGRIDAALLQEAAKGMDDPAYYVCGPPGMVESLARLLLASGVPRPRIKFEQFWGY